ncbi:hypothetical protein WN48_09001 [Eufriesea mexicana]|uniref:Uncharacterized protein n=1 Tax=Eufriesea mexicana TaxID=516756 RepID=A0A310SEK4_9HYME|nr:hypothetical protein WN48_09001 [Eufriesea mexicana]
MGCNPGSRGPGADKSRLARNEKSIDNNRINSVSAVTPKSSAQVAAPTDQAMTNCHREIAVTRLIHADSSLAAFASREDATFRYQRGPGLVHRSHPHGRPRQHLGITYHIDERIKAKEMPPVVIRPPWRESFINLRESRTSQAGASCGPLAVGGPRLDAVVESESLCRTTESLPWMEGRDQTFPRCVIGKMNGGPMWVGRWHRLGAALSTWLWSVNEAKEEPGYDFAVCTSGMEFEDIVPDSIVPDVLPIIGVILRDDGNVSLDKVWWIFRGSVEFRLGMPVFSQSLGLRVLNGREF